MPYLGVTTRPGTCAICKQDFGVGVTVYHDPGKRQGIHLAHQKCYDDLRASRDKQPAPGKEKLSVEPLDPPF